MIRVEAKHLKDHVGKYVGAFRADGVGSPTLMCRIVEVDPDRHLVVLRTITDATEDGETTRMYYRIGDKVDVYDHDEAVVLALKL
jgi:hypothetical protein